MMYEQCECNGYIGLGFSPSGGMEGSDIILGMIDTNSKIHLSVSKLLGQ